MMQAVIREIHRFHASDGSEAWVEYEFALDLPFFPRAGDRIVFRVILGGENGEEIVSAVYDALERLAIVRLADAHDQVLTPSSLRGHVLEMDQGRAIDGWRAVATGGAAPALPELASSPRR